MQVEPLGSTTFTGWMLLLVTQAICQITEGWPWVDPDGRHVPPPN